MSSEKQEEIVIRKLNPYITIFSRPFLRGGLIPFGGRSAAIKLSSGSYLLTASTPLTPQSQASLDGPVEYIVSLDAVHWLFVAEWAKAYPNAKVFGVDMVVPKQDWKSLGVEWTGIFSADNPTGNWPKELQDEVKVEFFGGFLNRDLTLLHVPSKTLIEADLLFNLPAVEQHSQSNINASPWYLPTSFLKPGTWFHKFFINGASKDKVAMGKSAAVVASWDFDTIVPCHGDVITSGAKVAWTSTYSKLMDLAKKSS